MVNFLTSGRFLKLLGSFLSGVLLIPLILFSSSPKELTDNILVRALSDELKRSISELRIEKQAKSYYIAYRVVEERKFEIKSSLGGLLSSDESKNRILYVDVRVGDYQLDNSNFICPISGSRIIESDRIELPIEDEYLALRQRAWLVTDGTYKKALEKFARKKAYLQNKQTTDTFPDFVRVIPCSIIEEKVELKFDRKELNKRLVELSRIFEKFPEIVESAVDLKLKIINQYFLDSEGAQNLSSDGVVGIEVRVVVQGRSGEVMEDFTGFYVNDLEELDFVKIANRINAWADTLCQQINLKKEEGYSGPVLFLNQASAELFFQILGKGVSDVRQPIYESENLERNIPKSNTGILAGKLGRKVAPQFISAFDDPGIEEWNGVSLIGAYKIDDQGVKSERVDLIKDGKLTGLLMSRTPTSKIKTTNGHARYCQEMYGPRFIGFVGNLIINSAEKKTTEELISKLKEIAREYGNSYAIVVTRLSSARPKTQIESYQRFYGLRGRTTPLISSPTTAYKIDLQTGDMQLIKGLDFSQTTPRVLRDIIAAGDAEYAHNFIYYDDYGNEYPVSVIAPPVLVEEMELIPREIEVKKLPVVSRPK